MESRVFGKKCRTANDGSADLNCALVFATIEIYKIVVLSLTCYQTPAPSDTNTTLLISYSTLLPVSHINR